MIATNDQSFHQETRALVVVYEGLFTYGGLNGRDMEAIATGLYEMVDESNIRWNLYLIRRLTHTLHEARIPVVLPDAAANGVYIDAKAFLNTYKITKRAH